MNELSRVWARCSPVAIAVCLCSCTMRLSAADFFHQVKAGPVDTAASGLREGTVITEDRLPTPDGEQLYRVRFSHPQSKTTLLFFGGNASTLGPRPGGKAGGALQTAITLTRDWQVDVVMADYRGYGQSTGTPTLETLKRDALALYDAEATLAQTTHHRLAVGGFSLGGVVAGSVVEARNPDVALLVATTNNVPDLVTNVTPWYWKPFVFFDYELQLLTLDNARVARKYGGLLLVAGSEKDSSIPVELVKKIYEASALPPESKQLVIAASSEHNDVLQSPELREGLKHFVSAHSL